MVDIQTCLRSPVYPLIPDKIVFTEASNRGEFRSGTAGETSLVVEEDLANISSIQEVKNRLNINQ
jgi:hypothetical protein